MKHGKIAEQFARWWWVVAVAVVALGAVAALVFVRPVTTGVAVANHAAVVAVQADRAAAAAQQAALEAALKAQVALDLLEDQTLQSMQDHLADPANGLSDEGLAVVSVGLIKTGDNAYEGMATMSRMGGPLRDIPIHVIADERRLQWNIDPGALLVLFG